MTGNQSGNETARNLVPENARSYVRLRSPMPGCRQDREGSVVACERSQLHFKRRILGSRECESAGIDRDENGVNALLGVSYSIDSGGTVGQRSCVRTSLLCTTPDSSTSSRCLQTFRQTVERPNIIRVLCTPLNSTPLNPKSSQQTPSAPL